MADNETKDMKSKDIESKDILVFIEQRKGVIKKASLEALSEAIRQSKNIGGSVLAVLICAEGASLLPEISCFQPNKIIIIQDPEYLEYSTESYANALATAIKQTSPKYVFAANTAMGKDLLPRVAARFKSPCVTDVVELISDGNNLLAVKPMYSAKAYGKFAFNSNIAFMTLRPNVFIRAEQNTAATVPTETLSCPLITSKAKVIETKVSEKQKLELTEAPMIVSGGRGIKGPENWAMLQALCDVLGAALGASRAVVDAGWISHDSQVGQTGKTVSPQLYIACGISGAIQHLAGMSSSKNIVAINNNPDAPIFKLATYGVVGDVFEIVPKLTEAIKKLKEQS